MCFNHQNRTVALWLALLPLAFLLLPGCGNSGGDKEDMKPMKTADAKTDTPLDSANGYLAVADLDKFRTERPRFDILKDLKWRAGPVEMADCHGKAICAITYTVLMDGRPAEESLIWIHALFVNDKFVKFIDWLPATGVAKRVRVGDCGWLARALEAKSHSIEDLRKEAKSTRVTPKQTDIGLTIAWLLLRPQIKGAKPPSVDDYIKNAALRDEFNAARLDIGMTELQVDSILKAKPLEQGKVDAGLYKIYGSNESLNINYPLNFSNILVAFRDGKVIAVYSSNYCTGDLWRRGLGEEFIDLPKP